MRVSAVLLRGPCYCEKVEHMDEVGEGSCGVNLNKRQKSFNKMPALHRVFSRRAAAAYIFVCGGRPSVL